MIKQSMCVCVCAYACKIVADFAVIRCEFESYDCIFSALDWTWISYRNLIFLQRAEFAYWSKNVRKYATYFIWNRYKGAGNIQLVYRLNFIPK